MACQSLDPLTENGVVSSGPMSSMVSSDSELSSDGMNVNGGNGGGGNGIGKKRMVHHIAALKKIFLMLYLLLIN